MAPVGNPDPRPEGVRRGDVPVPVSPRPLADLGPEGLGLSVAPAEAG